MDTRRYTFQRTNRHRARQKMIRDRFEIAAGLLMMFASLVAIVAIPNAVVIGVAHLIGAI